MPTSALWALPFAALLIAVALAPNLLPHLWESGIRRAVGLALLAAPTVVMLAAWAPHVLAHALEEYVAFMALLIALWGISAGVELTISVRPGLKTNLGWLVAGTAMASVAGTTGASMLLIRPYLRAQAGRPHAGHTVVFFIFLVSNVGGMLLPLGDPPLYLGYLRGVPFLWTLRLWPMWLCVSSLLLGVFTVIDARAWRRHPPGDFAPGAGARFALRGGHNLGLALMLVAAVGLGPTLGLGQAGQTCALLTLLAISYATTPKDIYRRNGVTPAPIIEVGQVFAALFVTMPPALAIFARLAPKLGAVGPEGYFWATGSLSAVLDNAPCYLTFASIAASLYGPPQAVPGDLAPLAADPIGAGVLAAVAAGSVAMGAMTYIGNGPNLLVRAEAQTMGVRPPSFLGFIGWSMAVLLPILAAARCMCWLWA